MTPPTLVASGQGLVQRDAQHSYLAGELIDEGPLDPLWGHSITWRIAVGPQAGRKVLTLQTLPAGDPAQAGGAGNVGGFSLHAGVAVRVAITVRRANGRF